ncbi:MAG TPA: aldehyde dehydrogenase (NADP(+)) [Chthonomonadaceae bacterium]|nr:aldehyde dehydrogenase (NADP(+)) [Chthonomonadaceae bacterium]
MQIPTTSLIAGEPAAGAGTFHAANPATGERLAPDFCEASAADVDRAMALAEAAFRAHSRPAAEQVALLLDAIADEIERLGDALLERASAETGLPLARLAGERGRTIAQLKMFSALVRDGSWVDATIDGALPERKPLPKPDLRRMLIPIGPVVVFGASNFPLAFSVAGGDTASAFAAGCPVVVKGHPAHPGTCALVAGAIGRAVERAGLPAGWFSLIQGAQLETGQALVRHPAARAVGFTGSLRGGRALFDAAAARPDPIPVYAEMGSVNPVFVLPGALRARGAEIAEGLTGSITMGVGQFCTKPGLVFGVKSDPLDGFAQALAAKIGQAAPGTMLHEGIRRAFEAGVARAAATEGVAPLAPALLHAGPAAGPESTRNQEPGTSAAAAVYRADGATFLAQRALHEEIFGPAALMVACGAKEELEAAAEALEGQLTATVHGTAEDLAEFRALVAILERKAGRIVYNGFPTGVEVCPAMVHGGPYPATTDSRTTSVGTLAIARFARPVCYQGFPQEALPPELQDGNPRGIWRTVDGELTRAAV